MIASAKASDLVIVLVPVAQPAGAGDDTASHAHAFYALLERLARGGHRHVLMCAQRALTDPDYVFSQLHLLFAQNGIAKADVARAHASLATGSAGTALLYPPRDPAGFIAGMLGASFVKQEQWRHADRALEQIDSPYYEIWKAIPGGHKKYAYFALYDRLFAHLRGAQIKVLEIGIYKGASLKAWRRYLGEGATIIGIDVNKGCLAYDDPTQAIHVRIGSQADAIFLQDVVAEFGPFDIVLDDGSHQTAHQIESFKHLFTGGLKPGGIYFLEDINTSFWPSHRNGPYDVFDLLNACMLGMNHFYLKHRPADFAAASHPGAFPAIALNTLVREVRVFDSACAIYKSDETVYPTLVIRN